MQRLTDSKIVRHVNKFWLTLQIGFTLLGLILLSGCKAPLVPNPSSKDLSAVKIHGKSFGCGVPHASAGIFMPFNIDVQNQARTYNLRVPDNYQANHAYPVIFRWHGSGGNGLSGGLGIESIAGKDAIIVAPDGLNQIWRSDKVDIIFFDHMLETISKQYCIDSKRVFSYGFSVGGFFTNQLACERGDVLRASAAIAGGAQGSDCKGKVARWFLHDLNDNVVPIENGRAARDKAIAINGCTASAVNESTGCIRYQSCQSSPVVWCESKGIGHNIRGDFAPEQVWKFFNSLH